MTPDPGPTVQQLLAFYLEAGVDCALTDAPVNRLSDPDIAQRPREPAPPSPVSPISALIPAERGEPARAPAAASLSAREGTPTPAPPPGGAGGAGAGAGSGDRVGAGGGADRADARSAARAAGKIRRLRAEVDRHPAGSRRRQAAR